MATERNFSRRNFLGMLAGAVAASALPARGADAASAAAGGATNAAAAATTPGLAAKPARAGQVVVWQYVDYLPETTQLIRDRYQEVGGQKGINVVYDEVPNNKDGENRFIASVQAGTPPDIFRLYDYQIQYWRAQGQLGDVSDIVSSVQNAAGGFWQPVEQTIVYQGRWYGVPQAVNCWPFHVRQDILDQNGLSYPKDWDEFRAQGRQLTKPPLYYYGHTLGKTNDTNNHFLGVLWTFGGKLQNEDGSLAVKAGDDAWLATLDLLAKMYNDDKIIPPGSVNWDDGSNNQGYQSEQLVMTSNPTSVYNWLVQNKPELAKATRFYSYPAGPAGSYGQVDVWAQCHMKNGQGGEDARTLLYAFADPTWYATYVNKQLKGRFVPVHRNMLNDDLWTKNDLYTEYQKIIETGRIMAYAGAPLGGIAELTSLYIIGDLVQDVLVKRLSPSDALATFVRSAEEIYNKPENRA